MSKDVLEIIEYIQLCELASAGLVTDIGWMKRIAELSQKYTRDDVESVSLSSASKMFGDITGHLNKQKCTNKECGYVFRSADVSELCDICYHPTLRLVDND